MKTKQYPVLKIRYVPTGQFLTGINRFGDYVRSEFQHVEWDLIGQALDMADAKAQFGGSPVLGEAA